MSYTSDLENVIAKRLGRQPCKDDNSNFYYEIVDATKKGCCLLLTVSVTVTGCIDDIFSNICFLDTSLTWSFEKEDDEYTANVILFDILINCCSSSNNGSLITQTEVTVNEVQH